MSEPTLDISEIFFSIQGESSRIGLPCVFVRLSFCSLRCRWCDSEYTFVPGKSTSIDEIVAQVKGYACPLVEITGGEPLLQEGVHPLMTQLCDEGLEVLLETSGSLDISRVDPRVRRIVDIKCPGSGMVDRNRWRNLESLTRHDEIKLVVASRDDYVWARDVIHEQDLPSRCPVLMSPVFGELENLDLAQWILEDHLPVRYQLQLHKYIWDPQARGV